MKQSYRVSEGYVIPLALLSLPLFARMIWEPGLPYFAVENIVLASILKNLFIGLTTLIQIGVLATAYLTIKRGSAGANE